MIFSDISQDLLDHCRQAAQVEGVLDRCSFVLAPADRLSSVPAGSVDIVTTRSVLIYVKDKAAALREFHRVLRPGGRISVSEPINVLMGFDDHSRFFGYDIRPVMALAEKVEAIYESIQPHGKDPMGDFDERDLVRHAEDAGFPTIDLELRATVKNARQPMPWTQFLQMSGNPLMPCADHSTICARRHVTTDPLPRRTIRFRRLPSSSLISRTRTRRAIPDSMPRSTSAGIPEGRRKQGKRRRLRH